jgi:hypothetical protein
MQKTPILDPAECERTRMLVHRLRPYWVQRAPLPFFTLGAATYMDAVEGRHQAYRAAAGRLNQVLSEHFEWLYGRVHGALASILQGNVTAAPGLALPGFHIFLTHPAFAQPLASVHLDLQYREHDWTCLGEPDFTRPVSFTLAIAIPAAGSGLYVWPQTLAEVQTMHAGQEHAATENATRSQQPRLVPYSAGAIVVHDGHVPHQIAPPPRIGPGDERITLQGHAVRCGDTWYTYW